MKVETKAAQRVYSKDMEFDSDLFKLEAGNMLKNLGFDDKKPVIGRKYKLIDITDKTLEQNGTFHDLIDILFDFMLKMDLFILENLLFLMN